LRPSATRGVATWLLAVGLCARVPTTVLRRSIQLRLPAMLQKPEVLFLDCDDCLYQNNWATAAKITTSIAAYTARLGVR